MTQFEQLDLLLNEYGGIILTLPESEIQNMAVGFGSMDYIFENKNMKQKRYRRKRMKCAERI